MEKVPRSDQKLVEMSPHVICSCFTAHLEYLVKDMDPLPVILASVQGLVISIMRSVADMQTNGLKRPARAATEAPIRPAFSEMKCCRSLHHYPGRPPAVARLLLGRGSPMAP
jgi:hypothetical protein